MESGSMGNKLTRVAKSATDALKHLWEEGFFRVARKGAAIDGHLAKRGNNFSAPELGMALKRARHLTRRGNRGSYEYIQKYPFISETPPPRTAKTASQDIKDSRRAQAGRLWMVAQPKKSPARLR